MTWGEASQLAPLFGTGIAGLALITAVASIAVQRKLARCRAAIDFFVKTEMDESMIAAFRCFDDGVKEFRSFLSMKAFMESDILAAHHNDTERLIAHIRRQPGGSATYEDLLRLHRRWNGRRWIWQRWRSYRWPFCL
jgi:hypothetical protein